MNNIVCVVCPELRCSSGSWWTVAGQRRSPSSWTPCSCAASPNTRTTTRTSEQLLKHHNSYFQILSKSFLSLYFTSQKPDFLLRYLFFLKMVLCQLFCRFLCRFLISVQYLIVFRESLFMFNSPDFKLNYVCIKSGLTNNKLWKCSRSGQKMTEKKPKSRKKKKKKKRIKSSESPENF